MTDHRSLSTFFPSNIEKAAIDVKKEQRGVMATAVREYNDAETNAFSIESIMKGGTCEACQ